MEKQISIVTVLANTNKLIQTLRHIKVAVGKGSKRTMASNAEITVTDGKFTIAVPGAIFSSDCTTQGTCKAIVSFLHFSQIIKDSKTKETEITITEGTLKINSVTISIKTTFIEDDTILKTIDLPINYTEGDLIRLDNLKPNGYTYEELEFNNLHAKIDNAYCNLDDNIFKAYSLLKQYGIEYVILKTMVHDKLYLKKINR